MMSVTQKADDDVGAAPNVPGNNTLSMNEVAMHTPNETIHFAGKNHMFGGIGSLAETLRSLVVLALMLLVTAPGIANDFERRNFLGHGEATLQPLWVFSGVWKFGEDHFMLADILNNAIVEYDLDGSRVGFYDESTLEINDFTPTFIQALPDSRRYVVESGNGQFIWLVSTSQGLKVDRRVSLIPEDEKEDSLWLLNEAGDRLLSTTTWTVTERFILAFGDIQAASPVEGKKNYYSAYVRVDLEDPTAFTVIGDEIGKKDPRRHRHYLGYSFSASAGEEGVVVVRENPFRIDLIGPNGSSFSSFLDLDLSFPLDENPWKSLPDFRGMAGTAQKLAELERVAVVTDVYVDSDFLYLIRRDGKKWFIERINRGSGTRDGGPHEIPVGAETRHLVSVFGEAGVIFVEKGKVASPGDQQVRTFILGDLENLF